MCAVEIGWAAPDEWSDIMTMVWRTFLEHEGRVYSQQGVHSFFEFITNDRLYQSFLTGYYQIIVARLKGEIVGMCSLRNGNFLSLLFVKDGYQGQGIGTRLVENMKRYLKTEAGQYNMLVKAAVGAEGFYLKNGFCITGQLEEAGGVQVIPMETLL